MGCHDLLPGIFRTQESNQHLLCLLHWQEVFLTSATWEAQKLRLLLLLSRFSCVRLCATHRQQPTRLPRPWDSPGKNTGVGCHFLLQCMKVKSEVAQSCLTLSNPMDCSPPGSSVHGIFQARVLEWGAIAFSKLKLDLIKWESKSNSDLIRYSRSTVFYFIYFNFIGNYQGGTLIKKEPSYTVGGSAN